MVTEECSLFADCNLYGLILNNILLRTIFDTDKTEPESYLLAHKRLSGIGSLVHDVDLCEHTNSANTIWINLLTAAQSGSQCQHSTGPWQLDSDRLTGLLLLLLLLFQVHAN